MTNEVNPDSWTRIKTALLGKTRSPYDRELFHKISLIAFFAWIGLGADGISSSCYGPSESFLALGGHAYLALLVAAGTVLTIFVISISYSQIVELFPGGGGGYIVASRLLSPTLGMVSGCALIIDYVLTIAVSISSGTDAMFSFLPPEWHAWKLWFAAGGVLALTLLNMRGVKESVVPLTPIFLVFIITHVAVILYAVATHAPNLPLVADNIVSDTKDAYYEIGAFGIIFLLMRAYSMGAGTYTGIEAVSNGLPILRDPKVKTAKRTMLYMAASLSFMVVGLMLTYLLYGVAAEDGKTLNAVLFEAVTRGWGETGRYLVLVTLVSEAALLFIAAQTGFLDGPRVLANMALDHWVPRRFALLSDRFVTQNGIIIIGAAAGAMVLFARGSVTFLVILYSINVFITFLLSQAGMVRHWWESRYEERGWLKKLAINAVGTMLTAFILASVVSIKFYEGGWLTLFVTGTLIVVVLLVRRHYNGSNDLIRRLDDRIMREGSSYGAADITRNIEASSTFDQNAKTAVLMVNGFNGIGVLTLSNIFRLFSGTFKNFVFVQIAAVDSGNFRGQDDAKKLEENVKKDVDRYVKLMRMNGYYAEGMSHMGVDITEEMSRLAPVIMQKYPNAVFFGGQVVFPKYSFLSRLLHNYSVFAIQRSLYQLGIPCVILPIQV